LISTRVQLAYSSFDIAGQTGFLFRVSVRLLFLQVNNYQVIRLFTCSTTYATSFCRYFVNHRS